MKLTIKELKYKLQLIAQIKQEPNDKLTYAIKKLHSIANKALSERTSEIQNKVTDLQIEYAAIDDKGLLIEKNEQYQYSKENKAKLVQEVRTLNEQYDKSSVEFEPYLVGVAQAPRILELDDFLVDEIGDLLFNLVRTEENQAAVADGPPGKTYPPPPVK